MSAKITIERILRDEDDASGQSIREWRIESEPGFVTIKLKHGDGFLMLRFEDIDTFVFDVHRAKEAAESLTNETKRS